jgi:hypothetical protein
MGGGYGYVRLSQTVAAVIVAAPRWAPFLLPHTWLSQIPHFRQINKSYFFPDSQSNHSFRHYNSLHQSPLSVPYGAEKGPKLNENR